ncbi:putative BPI/LBP family protein At1g04970 isoform X2 [Beta vulgaris subsp. vulgaris]|uniref:putative BPI/LBP family protein At1g04970 isoform X2 n=1 Tax=Beta vulgaris subsp. vulgaris TaxID=3555 RepID=UPI002036B76B|nr:putative BPI/LBP family protein At1g04970 isoform X2 [Beta vulgaris subsp. vulgaris]
MKPTPLSLLFLLSFSLLLHHHHRPPYAVVSAASDIGESSFISFLISKNGLNFLKDLLISKAISTLTPLHIPYIDQSVQIPFIGNVFVELSNISLHQIRVSDSYVTPGDSGVAFIVSGATANMSLDWYYSYAAGWLFPFQFSDHGVASIQVQGMQVGLTLYLEIQEGRLKLSLIECGCFVGDLSIELDGGASWLYQGIVDVFAEKIESAVEEAITKNLEGAILKLASFLESLPKQMPVDDIASLNVTFVNGISLSNSSIGFEIDGLFSRRDQAWKYGFYRDLLFHRKDLYSSRDQKRKLNLYEEHLQALSCRDSSKMIGISIDESVFHSASTLYFEAGYLQWIVDKIPDQALLNTKGWRFIIPQLYKKYPKDDMNLNVSLASPPVLKISRQNIDITANVDLIIDVLEGGQIIPVACIFLEIHASGSVAIRGNNLGGKVKLDDFQMTLKWSKIGNLKMFLIQPVIRTVIETVFVPYANARLWKGLALPMIHGFTLDNAKTNYLDSSVNVCSDVVYSELDDHAQTLIQRS